MTNAATELPGSTGTELPGSTGTELPGSTGTELPGSTGTHAPTVRTMIVPKTYRDSVELMRVAAELERLPDIARAGLVMATPANQAVLAEAGLSTEDARSAGPNDLVVAIAGTEAAASAALARARELLSGQPAARREARQGQAPRTIAEAAASVPDLNLALISVPGTYATAEALKALKRGLHIFLFSDNVPIEDEIALKTLARKKGRLVMGPDCGTAILDGIPLGFANVVRRGTIGIVAASGTGLQQVACLVDRAGQGLSQAIGVGGRDLDERVGGAMMLAGIDWLARDPSTSVLVLLSKPPAPAVAEHVLAAARASGKPVVVNFLGGEPDVREDGSLVLVPTLEDAAEWAIARARGGRGIAESGPSVEARRWATEQAERLVAGQWRICGLYSGGTLAKEAMLLIRELAPDQARHHQVIDLGDDEFTVGRPHPMIDFRLRNERILQAADDPETAVLLLDVVLGYGAHPDPAGELLPAIDAAQRRAAAAGRSLPVIASVCGTEGDPQGLAEQEARLAAAGVRLEPSNGQAARLAAMVVQEVRR